MAPVLNTLQPLLVGLLLIGSAVARQCSDFTIPISISSRQGLFKEVPITNNLDVNAFATRFNEYQTNYSATLLQGYQTLQGNYQISATYCRPDNGSSYASNSGGTLQLLSHGIGFDKTYWDLAFDNYNYSYVNTALAAGYSTLAIDRLGIGNSSHGDPLNEIQAQAEVEALNAVTTKIRNGEISQLGKNYSKIIHVGHSFGSVQSYWLSALYPNNTDGVVLTGFSTATQFMPYLVAGWDLHSARLNQPLRFGNSSNADIRKLAAQYNANTNLVPYLQQFLTSQGINLASQEVWNEIATTEILDLITGYNMSVTQYNYPAGYLTTADITALQYAFLFPGNYNLEFALMGEMTKQPVTTGELLTIGGSPMMSPFTGPVFVITGQHDVPFCGGNCYGKLPNSTAPTIPDGAKMAFPSASAFEAYIQPGSGHGLNFQYNATAGYKVIQNWLAGHGLAAS